MGRDFSVFLQPGFWLAIGFLVALVAVAVIVIATATNYPVPTLGG